MQKEPDANHGPWTNGPREAAYNDKEISHRATETVV
jgi:hypothetical protein